MARPPHNPGRREMPWPIVKVVYRRDGFNRDARTSRREIRPRSEVVEARAVEMATSGDELDGVTLLLHLELTS